MYVVVICTVFSSLIASGFVRPSSSQFVPGYRCNDTYLMEKVYECEKSLVRALKNKPSSQCRLEVFKLQRCTGRFIFNNCYKTYAVYPKFRQAISIVMRLTIKQFNNALFYCHDNGERIDWTSIPHAVKRLLPCDTKFFQLSKKCSETFHSVYQSNRTNQTLCRLYEEAKLCRARLSFLHCKAALPINKQNHFCKSGFDESKKSGKAVTCMVDVCTTSSSNLVATPPCQKPRNVTCNTPPGSPFQFDACMNIRLTVEPFPGITIVEENRNCTSLAVCQSNLPCKNANRTGLLKACQTLCCHGNLCNKKPDETTSSLAGHKPTGETSRNCSAFVTSKLRQCNSRFHSMLINNPLTCRSAFGSLVSCYNSIQCGEMFGILSQLPISSIEQLYCYPLEGNDVPSSTKLMIQTMKPTILQQIIPCNLTFYTNNLRCLRTFIKIRTINNNDTRLCRFYQKSLSCIHQNAIQHCKMFTNSSYEDIRTMNPYCNKHEKCQGTWTKVNHSWISGQQSRGVQFHYITLNNSLVINANVTSYSCHGNPWLGLVTFVRGNWSKIKYTQEFRGSTSCWQIFGHSRQSESYTGQNNPTGLEEFSRRHGDRIDDELRMGGTNDTFPGFTSMCDNGTANFWHAQYGRGLRRATVILRRKPLAKHAGIGTTTSCGLPSYTIKDIYVYGC